MKLPNLSQQELEVVDALLLGPPLTIKQLSQSTRIGQGSLQVILAELERLKLVRKVSEQAYPFQTYYSLNA